MCELKKVCNACREEKGLSEFQKDRNTKTGYTGKCKLCIKNKISAPRLGTIKNYILTGEVKICKACKEEKDICYFSFNYQRGKLHAKCNICSLKGIPIIKEPIVEKRCKSCGLVKAVEFFYKARKTSYFPNCRECTNLSRKNYSKEYNRNNKIKINTYRRKRRAENNLVALRESISSAIIHSLKICNKKKSKNTEEILGCTILDFKKHIESQFLNWMSWDNRGNVCGTELQYNCSWDLDHIIPISSGKTESEILQLNHWSNFQPLCSKVNRDIKRNKQLSVTNLELKITKYENN